MIAISIMSGGCFDLNEAFDYIQYLFKLLGMAIGVATDYHPRDGSTQLDVLRSTTQS